MLLVAGAGSVTGDEVDGGIFGLPLFLGYLGLLIWIVATSILILRPRRTATEPAAALT